MRWSLGALREEVKVCGRWASNVYKIYLRKLDDRELKETVSLLMKLKFDSIRVKGFMWRCKL